MPTDQWLPTISAHSVNPEQMSQPPGMCGELLREVRGLRHIRGERWINLADVDMRQFVTREKTDD